MGADVLIVADDIDRTERELTAGELACPDCHGELRPWVMLELAGCAPATPPARSDRDAPAAAPAIGPTCCSPALRCCTAQTPLR